jgi:hypothetical protein
LLQALAESGVGCAAACAFFCISPGFSFSLSPRCRLAEQGIEDGAGGLGRPLMACGLRTRKDVFGWKAVGHGGTYALDQAGRSVLMVGAAPAPTGRSPPVSNRTATQSGAA